jgi:DNA-binding transcriptional LysR family regulator
MFASHDLAALVAVADSGSIHRAASALGRTQPAVTQAIQRLEEAVGFTLLDRSGYRVRLTERGETFVKRARVTVSQARDLRAFAAVLSRGVEARLRIVAHGAIPLNAWMHVITDIPQQFPDTVLEVQSAEGDAPMRLLMSDEADLAIALMPAPERHASGVESLPLGEIDFVNVVQTSRLVSDLERDLAGLPQILVADFDDLKASYGVLGGHRYWRVSDHRTKAAVIAAGTGWGSVPATMVDQALQDGSLSVIAYRGIGPRSRWPFYLYRKRDAARGPLAEFIWTRGSPEPPLASLPAQT